MAKTEKKQSLPKTAKTGAQDIAEQLSSWASSPARA